MIPDPSNPTPDAHNTFSKLPDSWQSVSRMTALLIELAARDLLAALEIERLIHEKLAKARAGK